MGQVIHLVKRLDQMIQVFVKYAQFACREDPVSGQEHRVEGPVRTPKMMFQRDRKPVRMSVVIRIYLAWGYFTLQAFPVLSTSHS